MRVVATTKRSEERGPGGPGVEKVKHCGPEKREYVDGGRETGPAAGSMTLSQSPECSLLPFRGTTPDFIHFNITQFIVQ